MTRFGLWGLLPFFCFVCCCFAATVQIYSNSDTSLFNPGTFSETDPSNYFGVTQDVRLYRGRIMFPIIRFPLSSIPAGATILNATIRISTEQVPYTDPGEEVIRTIVWNLFDVVVPFDERYANWTYYDHDRRWSNSYYDFSMHTDWATYWTSSFITGIPYSSTPGTWFIPATDLVKGAIDRNLDFAAFMIDSFYGSTKFWAHELNDPNRVPMLQIIYSTSAPKAVAGPDMIIDDAGFAEKATKLDGSASVVPQGITAAYSWTVVRPAPGSALAAGYIIGTNLVQVFAADTPGWWVVQLKVSNTASGEFTVAQKNLYFGLRRSHPRIHLAPSKLDQIRSTNASTDPIYQHMADAARNSGTYWSLPMSQYYTQGLMYLATKDSIYANSLWNSIAHYIFVNGANNTGGFKTLMQNSNNDVHTAAYVGCQVLGNVAVVYDWLYDYWSIQQRSDMLAWMVQEMIWTFKYNYYSSDYFRNDGAIIFSAATRVFLASYPESADTLRLFNVWYNLWDNVHAGWSIIGEGGGMGEGNGYGEGTSLALVVAAHAAYTAANDDLFVSMSFYKDKLLYDAFASLPKSFGGEPYSEGIPYNYPNFPQAEIPILNGDGRRLASWVSIAIRPVGAMLSGRFNGTDATNTWNYVYRQPKYERLCQNAVDFCFVEALWIQPPGILVQPSTLSHYAAGMGFVYVRSDWTEDATYFAYWAGPHLDTHQHYDQGGFEIFKRREIIPGKTGNYDNSGNPTSIHCLAYFLRTTSTNGILIGDPNELLQNFISGRGCDANGNLNDLNLMINGTQHKVCIPNDGGQRTMAPFGGGPGNVLEFTNYFSYIFNTAKITAYNDYGDFVAVSSDITNAYNNPNYSAPGNSPKVSAVLRKWVYLRKWDLFVIADTVTSTNPNFEKRVLIHSMQEITVNTTLITQMVTTSPGFTTYTGASAAFILIDDGDVDDQNAVTSDLRHGNASLNFATIFPKMFTYNYLDGRAKSPTVHDEPYFGGPAEGHHHTHRTDFYVKDYSEGVVRNHVSANWPPQNPPEAATAYYSGGYVGGYGRSRLEIVPSHRSATDFFLNMYRPSIDGINNAMVDYKGYEDDDYFGVYVKDVKLSSNTTYLIKFAKSTNEAPGFLTCSNLYDDCVAIPGIHSPGGTLPPTPVPTKPPQSSTGPTMSTGGPISTSHTTSTSDPSPFPTHSAEHNASVNMVITSLYWVLFSILYIVL